jgi:hypothetical protein
MENFKWNIQNRIFHLFTIYAIDSFGRMMKGRSGSLRTASRTSLNLASNALIPVVKKCHSSPRNARNANPRWFRCVWRARTWQRSTPQYGFNSGDRAWNEIIYYRVSGK